MKALIAFVHRKYTKYQSLYFCYSCIACEVNKKNYYGFVINKNKEIDNHKYWHTRTVLCELYVHLTICMNVSHSFLCTATDIENAMLWT